MKVIIAGSRTLADWETVAIACQKSNFHIDEVVSGGARGVDRSGEIFAKMEGLPCKVFPPDWEQLGKRAGFVRNESMADYADALVAVWDGQSKGTAHMIETMKKKNKPVYVYIP